MDIAARIDETHSQVLGFLPPDFLDMSDIPVGRARLAAMLGAGAPELPASIEVSDHLTAAPDGHEVLVRVYRPREARQQSPGLFWIHGGGLVLGDVSMDDAYCSGIAEELNIVVASVEYRLAPEAQYPIPVEDCYAGLSWFIGSVDALGLDINRIAIGGGSAGGGLAAATALLARDRGDLKLCFQLLTYPMIDDRNVTPSSHDVTDLRVWNRAANQAGWKAYLGDAVGTTNVSAYAAPARATDLSGLPPAIISVGDLDMFLDEDIAYARALLSAGVPTELHVYPGCFHGSKVLVAHAEISQRWHRDDMAALANAFNANS
jgi:acetyl esterase/lipase